jgi:hypothetical protein
MISSFETTRRDEASRQLMAIDTQTMVDWREARREVAQGSRCSRYALEANNKVICIVISYFFYNISYAML